VTDQRPDPRASDDSEAWAAAIVGASAAVLTIVALDVSGPLRTVAVLGYLLFVPGIAAIRTAGYTGTAAMLSLSLILSVGIDGTVAMALYAYRQFDPLLALTIVVALTILLVFTERLLAPSRSLTSLAPPAEDVGGASAQR
jgi:hypothetical protein